MYVGGSVGSREGTDEPNNHILTSEFNFTEDGRILGWFFYAQHAGTARLQVVSFT